MEQGLVHLYAGDGKGKTTAAMGLALRALGNKKRVTVVQFLKGMPSGEADLLHQLGATVYRAENITKFVFQMTEQEKIEAKAAYTQLLQQAACQPTDLLVLDEACAACALEMVDVQMLKDVVQKRPEGLELVLTGRDPAQWMIEAADYYTEMCCRKHPYEKGIAARKGIEF